MSWRQSDSGWPTRPVPFFPDSLLRAAGVHAWMLGSLIANLTNQPNAQFANRNNGQFFLFINKTVCDDKAIDLLTGGRKTNWFFADPLDKVNDRVLIEVVR
jgi:hypothetical protein